MNEHTYDSILALDITRALYIKTPATFQSETFIKLQQANLDNDEINNVLVKVENIVVQLIKKIHQKNKHLNINERLKKIVQLKSMKQTPVQNTSVQQWTFLRQRLAEEVTFMQSNIQYCKKVLHTAFVEEKPTPYSETSTDTSKSKTSRTTILTTPNKYKINDLKKSSIRKTSIKSQTENGKALPGLRSGNEDKLNISEANCNSENRRNTYTLEDEKDILKLKKVRSLEKSPKSPCSSSKTPCRRKSAETMEKRGAQNIKKYKTSRSDTFIVKNGKINSPDIDKNKPCNEVNVSSKANDIDKKPCNEANVSYKANNINEKQQEDIRIETIVSNVEKGMAIRLEKRDEEKESKSINEDNNGVSEIKSQDVEIKNNCNADNNSLKKISFKTTVLNFKNIRHVTKKEIKVTKGQGRKTSKYDKLKKIDTIFQKEVKENITIIEETKPNKYKKLFNEHKSIKSKNDSNVRLLGVKKPPELVSELKVKLHDRKTSESSRRTSYHKLVPTKRNSMPNLNMNKSPPPTLTRHRRLSMALPGTFMQNTLTNQNNTKHKLNLMRINNFMKNEDILEMIDDREYIEQVKAKIIELNIRRSSIPRKTSISSRTKSLNDKPLDNLIDRITFETSGHNRAILIGDPTLHQLLHHKDSFTVNLCNSNQTIQNGFDIIKHYMQVNPDITVKHFHILLGYNDIKDRDTPIIELVGYMEYYIKQLNLQITEESTIHIYGLLPRYNNHILNGRLKIFNEQLVVKIKRMKLNQVIYYTRKYTKDKD